MSILLRPYQERDFKNIEAAFEQFKGVMYQLPTGGGKSVVTSFYVNLHKSEPLLILAHKRKLITQMQKHLSNIGITAGILMGEVAENLDADIIIASIGTASRDKRIEVLLNRTNKFKRIVIDEAHRTRTPSYEKLLDALMSQDSEIKLLGITATPYRVDKKDLSKYYQTLICSDDIVSLTNQGYLAKYKIYNTPIGDIDEEVQSTESDYVVTALSAYMRKEKFLNYVVESYKKYADGLQTLVFCVDKQHAKTLMETFRKQGYTKVAYIDSDTKESEREKIFEDYESGIIQLIFCIETITEGVDLPETKCIVQARPTQSLVLYLQIVGRGLRPKADGSECIILDCAGNTNEHGVPASPKHWSLNPHINPNNPRKKNKVVGKRKDGTFTEDEDEMEFLELVEMTPEEYMQNMSGNIDSAVESNKKDEEKILELLTSIGNEVIRKSKIEGYEVQVELPTTINLNPIGTALAISTAKDRWSIPTYRYIRIEASKVSHKDVKFAYLVPLQKSTGYGSDSSLSSPEDFQKKLKLTVDSGKIAEYFQKKEVVQSLIEILEECQEISSNKINIQELEKAAQRFKEEQMMKKIETHLLTNTTVVLNETIAVGHYFQTGYGRANTLVFSKNKLLSTNEVQFLREDGSHVHTAKFLEKPKLLEILKAGKYGETQTVKNG